MDNCAHSWLEETQPLPAAPGNDALCPELGSLLWVPVPFSAPGPHLAAALPSQAELIEMITSLRVVCKWGVLI